MTVQQTYRWQARTTERLSALYLWLKGYRIHGRNQRFQGVEVDVLATRGGVWVVVEVKVRRTPGTDWQNAVSPSQQQRLRRVVDLLAARHQAPARLDLVLWQPKWPWIRHFQDI